MSALARVSQRDWNAALADFRDAEQALSAAARALDACDCDANADFMDGAERRILTRRIAAARSTVMNVHSCASATARWWHAFSGLVPGLSQYHASGVLELFTPLSIGALNSASAIMRVITGQVTDFLQDFNQRRIA
jgi:hypothetical protein